ncbi:hypothetical protein N8Z47_06090 [Salibacteraceae bacterium]|nr:hypothetical protein [Salibacteraceae bacterium]
MKSGVLIPLGLAVILLVCLLDMPYGYYQLVRIISFVCFIYLGIKNYRSDHHAFLVIFSIGVILFNPLFKVALGRLIWNIVDVTYAAILIFSIYKSRKTSTIE